MKTSNQRKTYGSTLVELGEKDSRICVLDADLCKSTMGCFFEEAYPDRHFEMGIGEANMASFAAGLALSGKIPYINSFAVFSGGRAYDQLRQSVALPCVRVRVGGSSAGLSDFGDGSTHQTVEDIAIMRAIPNMVVLCPADSVELKKMMQATVDHPSPVYYRICRNDVPEIYPEDLPFTLGKPQVLREGTDVVLFGTGILTYRALLAADLLAAEGVSARVVHVGSLKPLDEAEVRRCAEGVRAVVTAEEHSIIGGLGSAVAMALRGSGAPMECVAIQDKFGQSAHTHEELLEFYGLTESHIAEAARRALKG